MTTHQEGPMDHALDAAVEAALRASDDALTDYGGIGPEEMRPALAAALEVLSTALASDQAAELPRVADTFDSDTEPHAVSAVHYLVVARRFLTEPMVKESEVGAARRARLAIEALGHAMRSLSPIAAPPAHTEGSDVHRQR